MPLIEWFGGPFSEMRNLDSPGHGGLVPKANSGILPRTVRPGTTGQRRDVCGVCVVVTGLTAIVASGDAARQGPETDPGRTLWQTYSGSPFRQPSIRRR